MALQLKDRIHIAEITAGILSASHAEGSTPSGGRMAEEFKTVFQAIEEMVEKNVQEYDPTISD